MFLIKHIVSPVRPSVMNSSSVSEKAAVERTMGNLSSVLQKEDTTPAMESGIESGVKTRRKKRLDETMEMISPTKFWVVRCNFFSPQCTCAARENEKNKEQNSIMREREESVCRDADSY